MTDPRYGRPASLDEALALLAEEPDDCYVLAGGTTFMLLRKQGLIDPALIVDLGGIDELRGITSAPDGGLVIGAMTTLREVETSPLVRERAPALASTVARVATVRIRNQATIGGNLAHADPAQDPPPMLLVLDAELEVAGPGGFRREAIDGFFTDVFETRLGPGEILTRIFVPPVPSGSRVGYEKFLPRTADDYATVAVAARLDVGPDGTIADARIALGAAAAVPLRVAEAEALVRGAPISRIPADEAARAVVAAVDPVDDARGSAGYKRAMAGVWTARLLRRLADAEPRAGVAA